MQKTSCLNRTILVCIRFKANLIMAFNSVKNKTRLRQVFLASVGTMRGQGIISVVVVVVVTFSFFG